MSNNNQNQCQIYTSYFSYSLKAPLYVSYDLYNGGGDYSRKNLRFKDVYHIRSSDLQNGLIILLEE